MYNATNKTWLVFLSTLSLRRATHLLEYPYLGQQFLSTLSLRRATSVKMDGYLEFIISIHALLAESDSHPLKRFRSMSSFLSTLSLRRATGKSNNAMSGLRHISIHALLAESDTRETTSIKPIFGISIHALLAESDIFVLWMVRSHPLFLSTLSLRRATT